jgi:hypothetical protein
MTNLPPERLLAILRIAHDTSRRGDGISLVEALDRTHYFELRPQFEARDLLPFLQADPELVRQWVAYSEDKRTSGGWWIRQELREVGRFTQRGEEKATFGTLAEAVAEYVVRELDSTAVWLHPEASRRSTDPPPPPDFRIQPAGYHVPLDDPGRKWWEKGRRPEWDWSSDGVFVAAVIAVLVSRMLWFPQIPELTFRVFLLAALFVFGVYRLARFRG